MACGGTRSAIAPQTRDAFHRCCLGLESRGKGFHHAGDQDQPADTMLFHGSKQRLDLEAVDHHHRPSAKQGCQSVIRGRHMKHRCPCDKGIAMRNIQLGGEHQRTHDHRAMRYHGAFRQAGGAAGVEDHQAVFGFGRNGRAPTSLLLQQLFVLRADFDHPAVFDGWSTADCRRAPLQQSRASARPAPCSRRAHAATAASSDRRS